MAAVYAVVALVGAIVTTCRSGDVRHLSYPFSFLIIGFAWVWQLQKARRFILVSPKTIRIVSSGESVEIYYIMDVGDITWDFVYGDVYIAYHDGRMMTTIPRNFLNSHRALRRMVKLIKSYAAAESESVSSRTLSE